MNAKAEHAEVGGWFGQFGISLFAVDLRSHIKTPLCIMVWKNREDDFRAL
jgi:hypothetical protein